MGLPFYFYKLTFPPFSCSSISCFYVLFTALCFSGANNLLCAENLFLANTILSTWKCCLQGWGFLNFPGAHTAVPGCEPLSSWDCAVYVCHFRGHFQSRFANSWGCKAFVTQVLVALQNTIFMGSRGSWHLGISITLLFAFMFFGEH